jgi:hypothetical protein
MSSEAGGVAVLAGELLYERKPEHDARAIAETIAGTLPKSAVITEAPGILLVHEDHPIEFEEGTKAVLTMVVHPDEQQDGVARGPREGVPDHRSRGRACAAERDLLATLGLADFQMHLRDLDESRIGAFPFDLAADAVERPGALENGDAVGDEHWKLQYELAIAGPERVVLDVDPGAPYAAGVRHA